MKRAALLLTIPTRYALGKIPFASSKEFFQQLQLGLYFSYGSLAPNEMESFVQEAISRVELLFGADEPLLYEFWYHQLLLDELTDHPNQIPRTKKLIEDAKYHGIDSSRFKEKLARFYLAAGQAEKALPILEETLLSWEKQLNSQSAKTNLGLRSLVLAVLCRTSHDITLISQRLKLEENKTALYRYCFNDFEWPAHTNRMGQTAALNFILQDLVEQKKSKSLDPIWGRKLHLFAEQTLNSEKTGDPSLVPFALMAMLTTNDIDEMEVIRETYLKTVDNDYHGGLSVVDEKEVDFFLAFADTLIAIDNNWDLEAEIGLLLKPTLEFAISEIEPSLKNTISHLLTNTRVTDAESSGGFGDIDRNAVSPEILELFFRYHQFAKFGPVEQILLRNKLLQSNKKSQIRSLLAQRDILFEQIFFEKNSAEDSADPFTKIDEIHQQISLIEIPVPKWEEELFSLEEIQNRLNANQIYLDYRHNASTNRLEVFRVTKSDISYNEIANAKDST